MPLLTTNQGLSQTGGPLALPFPGQAVTMRAETLPSFTAERVCKGNILNDLLVKKVHTRWGNAIRGVAEEAQGTSLRNALFFFNFAFPFILPYRGPEAITLFQDCILLTFAPFILYNSLSQLFIQPPSPVVTSTTGAYYSFFLSYPQMEPQDLVLPAHPAPQDGL